MTNQTPIPRAIAVIYYHFSILLIVGGFYVGAVDFITYLATLAQRTPSRPNPPS
jgi:hypothetical protein